MTEKESKSPTKDLNKNKKTLDLALDNLSASTAKSCSSLLVERDDSASDDYDDGSYEDFESTSSSSSDKDLLKQQNLKGSPASDVPDDPFLDELIHRLMSAPSDRPIRSRKNRIPAAPLINVALTKHELFRLCDLAVTSFSQQNSLLRFERSQLPLIIAGDIHGQFRDLRTIFLRCGPPQVMTYLFLGDYVDRGVQGLEVITLLLALKIKYPSKVFMLRGNHEDGNTCMTYGFYDEIVARFAYDSDLGEKLWRRFVHVFNWLPLAAIIADKILAMHGGISPHLKSLKDIESVKRPSIVPPYGLMCDLVWSDPDEKNDGWTVSSRGISLTFGESVVEKLCETLGIELIIRAHQLISSMIVGGYRFFASGRLLTIFSAPNYLNMSNDACVVRISRKLRCRFIVFRTERSHNAGDETIDAAITAQLPVSQNV